MMKRMQRIAVLAMAVCLIMGTMAVSVFADGDYNHKLTVTPGNGSFSSGSSLSGDSITVTDGVTGTLTAGGKTVTVEAPDEYHFVTGIKEAGHDIGNNNSNVIVGTVDLDDEDVDYVVAYGLKSNMVEYSVVYTGPDGTLDSETHYGVIGEKPVISFKYFDGYAPANAYNITGTLSADASENVFEFLYNAVDNEGNVITVVTGTPGAAAAAAPGAAGAAAAPGAAGAAGAGDAGAAGANIGDAGVPLAEGPADTLDLDDGQTPTTDPTELGENETPTSSPWKKAGIAAGAIAVVAIAAAAIAAARRRREEEEEEEEEGI